MSTVKAAVKRSRDAGGWNLESPGDIEDLTTLAQAYLDEHPSDDDELVTVAWLEETGLNLLGSPRSGSTLSKTRGDVRRLCKALGIELDATRNALEKCRDRNEGAGNAC